MTLNPSSGADQSRDFYSLTYRDPTGETAVRNLMGRSAQLTWENGVVVHLNAEDLTPLLAHLDFRMSRKGHIWGHKKKAQTGGNRSEPRVTSKGNEND